jgi:hypothetical protein
MSPLLEDHINISVEWFGFSRWNLLSEKDEGDEIMDELRVKVYYYPIHNFFLLSSPSKGCLQEIAL